MKIVIAPDSFKGSLTAKEVADSIERGIKKVYRNSCIVKVPMADGGEGTVQSLVDCTDGKMINVNVKDPLMRDINAFYGMLGDGETAVIEMASSSGLDLVSNKERNPAKTTTYGTGELIKHAMNNGCRNIIIGLGGSATNDGGTGMLKALGVKFLDENNEDIGLGGGSLSKLQRIDIKGMDHRVKECKITAACDVNNPLCGPEGASYIFGAQKGADEDMIRVLDKNLTHYADVIKKDIGVNIINIPGAGAAGGLGGGLLAFLNVDLQKGIEIVMKVTNLEEKVKDSDIVITGEGMIDYQTSFGKTPYGVAKIAKKYGIPVIAIAGGIGKDTGTLYDKGFDSIFSIVNKPMSLDEAIINAKILLEDVSERIMRVLCINRNQ